MIVASVAASSCGSDAPATPVACLASSQGYLTALDRAPGPVRLDDTRISDCLTEEQPPGQLASIGEAVVGAATRLNSEARRGSDRGSALRLGYLVGAVEQGAESSGGIHQDLVLRLNAAARFTGQGEPDLGAAFERAFGEGYAAAQQNG